MKYLLLVLLLTTGCATTHSEYYNGCYDVLDLIVISPDKSKENVCNGLEMYRVKQAEDARERSTRGRALR